MKLMHDIEQLYHKFIAEDFNHLKPNAIFMSVDVFHDLLRNVKPEYVERNPTKRDQWYVIGLDIIIVENKRNFMHVARI